MKKLIVINGTMGVGKSALCERLYKSLENSVWLDGDWCWLMHPWMFSEENILMVEENITILLGNYLKNTGIQYIVFSWVLHDDAILSGLLAKLKRLAVYKKTETVKIDTTDYTIDTAAEEIVSRLTSLNCDRL
ncbi:MAG: AAA family ATPase [Spirochaetia bacterium]